jgi:hypothetical protein
MKEWAKLFVELFISFSPSNLKLPKLHHFIYHSIETIYMFGSINGYNAETYESLHKYFVKIPYRQSNKKNINEQILTQVNQYNLYYYLILKL